MAIIFLGAATISSSASAFFGTVAVAAIIPVQPTRKLLRMETCEEAVVYESCGTAYAAAKRIKCARNACGHSFFAKI